MGDFFLSLKLGDGYLTVVSPGMQQLSITCDLLTVVPTVRFKVSDPESALSFLYPLDSQINVFTIQFSGLDSVDDASAHSVMPFKIHNKFYSTKQELVLEGSLDIPNLYYPKYRRGYTDSVKSIVSKIALDDLKLDGTDISQSLSSQVSVVQPFINNFSFLERLRNCADNSLNSGGLNCFIKVEANQKKLVFKTFQELISVQPKRKFALIKEKQEDIYPISSVHGCDVYDQGVEYLKPVFSYSYFDYDLGEYVSADLKASEYAPSLASYFLIDANAPTEETDFIYFGRNNSLSGKFSTRAKGIYHRSLLLCSKLWIATQGMQDIYPGDIVQFSALGININDQKRIEMFSGFWMVERVVHNFSTIYFTQLLLTREGVDVDSTIGTTLVPASYPVRHKITQASEGVVLDNRDKGYWSY